MPTTARAAHPLEVWQDFLRTLLRHWLLWLGAPLLLLLAAPPLALFGQAAAMAHLVLEMVTVALALLVFAVAWHMYPRNRQAVALLAGCGFLVVALLEAGRLLASPGMPAWLAAHAAGAELEVFWGLAARVMAACVLLGVTVAPGGGTGKPGLPARGLLAALGLTCLLAGLIIVMAPGRFAGAADAMPLRLAGACLAIAILVAALVRLVRRPAAAGGSCDRRRLGGVLLTMIAAELMHLSARPADDLLSLLGQIYAIAAYYQLFLAMFIGMIQEPFLRMQAAEEGVRQNQANLAALFEASPDGIFVVDRHGKIVRANQQAAAMFGYPGDGLVGRSHLELLPGSLHTAHAVLLEDYFANPQPRLMGAGRRLSARRRDGAAFPVEVGLSPVTLGGEMHVIATVRDVAVRDQLERQLEASESRLRNFIDNAVDWMWEVDAAGRYTYASRSVQALLGHLPADVVGRAPADFMPAAEAWRIDRIWRDCVARRAPIEQMEAQYHHCDGRLVTLETSGLPFFDAAGAYLGYRGINRDVTRRNEIRQALKQSEQRFRLAFDLSPIGMAIADPRGRFLHVNATLAAMLGYAESELCRLAVADIAHAGDYAACGPWRHALHDGRVPAASFEIRFRHKNGGYLWSQTSVAVAGAPGRVDYLLTQIRDITAERDNRERNARLLAIIERTEDAVGTMGEDGRLTYLNPAARRLLCIGPEEDVSPCRLADFLPPEIAAQIAERAVPQANRNGIWEGETLWRSREGEDIPMWQVVMAHKNAAGAVDYWSTVARDLREIRQWQDRLAYQDTHDMLTALPNRYLVRDRLQQSMATARRTGRLVAVMVIDIDHFKRINDGMGHACGDTVLLELSQRLRQSLRESDTLARQGGDEYIALLPDVALVQDVVAIADKLNACFDAPIPLGERDLYITASIGIAVFPFDEDSDEELLRKAEVAMYRAKELGRNTYQFYTSDMDRRYREDLEVEVDLRHAIERDELLLHYQPKFCLADGTLTGFEALVRWQHPQRGLIQPGRFIPVAERSNLIVALGEWTLRAACRQMVDWLAQGFDPGHIAVNVSALQFAYSDVAAMVRQVLRETGLAPHRLELEITESILMRDPVITSHLLDELKAIDVGIAIDDFGTGYSSLNYLKRFPVDVLKIDRAFVQDVAINEDDAAIVRAVISMANALGIGVVAEGVETQEQHDFLRTCGCDLVQGFLFGRPADAAVSLALMRQTSGSSTTR